MIKYIWFFLTILMLFIEIQVNAQISFVGFEPQMCTFSLTNTYTYVNYPVGSHGNGYKIYRNGTLILTNEANYGGYYLIDLVFMNDSTGFLVDYQLQGHVYKTTNYGNSWQLIAYCPHSPFPGGIYIINSDYVYIVNYDTNNRILVTRAFTDVYNQVYVINDTIPDIDLFATDSVLCNSICGNDSLRIKIKSNSDTITYHINCNSPLTQINDNSIHNVININPNPTEGHFFIEIPKELKNETKLTLQIFDNKGQLLQQTPVEMMQDKISVNITAEAKGIYNAILSNGVKSYTGKIIFE